MPKFFVDKNNIRGSSVYIDGDNVIRLYSASGISSHFVAIIFAPKKSVKVPIIPNDANV